MSNLSEKLRKIRHKLGLSQNQITEKLIEKGMKISSRTIHSFESEERTPALKYLQALINYFDVNPEWLLSNRGEMFYSENSKTLPPANVDISNMVFIPLYDITTYTKCNSLISNDNVPSTEYISFTKTRLSKITLTDEQHLIGFTDSENSNSGKISNGNIIIVDTQNNNLSIDGTYIVNIDNHIFVKILQRVPGNKVQVISQNNECKPFLIDFNANNSEIIGKVIWVGEIRIIHRRIVIKR